MPQFLLKIELGNEGMKTYTDIEDALSDAGHNISTYCTLAGKIRDINGNVVGSYQVVD